MTSAFPTLQLISLKAYYRNRQAIFFSLIFPLVIMVIFGLLHLGARSTWLSASSTKRTAA